MWDNVKQLIGNAAPLIGSLIAGPAGSAVGSLVASALGVENSPGAIEAELRTNPDSLLKLKQLELENAIELKRLSLEEAGLKLIQHKAELVDTQHAREQHKDHWMPNLLAIAMVVMVAGMFAALMFGPEVPQRYDNVLMIIAGSVLTAFSTAIAYWLGSSKGSADKTKHLKVAGG